MGRLTSHFSGLLNSKLWIFSQRNSRAWETLLSLVEQRRWSASCSGVLCFLDVFEFRPRLLFGAGLTHKVESTHLRSTLPGCLQTGRTEFLYSSGFSTEYITRAGICALSHTLELFGNWQWTNAEFDSAAIIRPWSVLCAKYCIRLEQPNGLCVFGEACSLYYTMNVFR